MDEAERPGGGPKFSSAIVKNNESRPTTNNRGYDRRSVTAPSFVTVGVTVGLHAGAIREFQFH
jgi:hypothetical protein